MPRLAPAGSFPGLRGLMARALLGLLDADEIRAEIERQLDRFEAGLRFPPDHIDGHQHVHVLPGMRRALAEDRAAALSGTAAADPRSDRPAARHRRAARWRRPKAMSVAALALGFAGAARRRGLPVNDSFAGFSDFDVSASPTPTSCAARCSQPGRRHLVMCHPGHPDAELAGLDPVVARRRMEYDALMRDPDLPQRIWRPSRSADGPPLSWLVADGD